ncbi:MAG: hypothetical protein ACOY3L_02440 [Pseudomonadota bacterium]
MSGDSQETLERRPGWRLRVACCLLPFVAIFVIGSFKGAGGPALLFVSLLFGAFLLCGVRRHPSPSALKKIMGPTAIFGIVLPFLPFAGFVAWTTDNPWDELCADARCLIDPAIWASFLVGGWVFIVLLFSLPAFLIWIIATWIRERGSGPGATL